MLMDEILTKKAEISEYLNTLANAHRRYLFDVQNSETLDKLRKDIHICLNDLCILNTMLVSSDGEGSVKQELDRLAKYSRKIEKLDQQSGVASDLLQQWNEDSETTPQVLLEDSKSGETFTFSTHYRQFLNRYLDNVGISNTSVADLSIESREALNHEYERSASKEPLLLNISLLQSGNAQAQQEIQQLESVLASLKKDQAFIQQELQNQQNEVQSVKAALKSNLESIHRSQEKVLNKLNIVDDTNRQPVDIALFARFSKTRQENNGNDLTKRLAYAKDYVKARQEILTANSKTYKEDLRHAESTRNLWDESLNRIRSLEQLLRTMLAEHPDTSPLALSTEISTVISQLQDTNVSASSEILKVCLGDEIEVLKRANEELMSSAGNENSKKHREPNGGIILGGASPPKLGINKENVTFSSRSLLSSNKANVSAVKAQKKE
ncbi:LAFA_0G12750g1_1 [Lachancea sp. 'fantastica']|nr:LAFA_0G12750g1_1 [Lachancea sp. 'fantastica']